MFGHSALDITLEPHQSGENLLLTVTAGFDPEHAHIDIRLFQCGGTFHTGHGNQSAELLTEGLPLQQICDLTLEDLIDTGDPVNGNFIILTHGDTSGIRSGLLFSARFHRAG